MYTKPKVSLIIPVYNPPIHFLKEFYLSAKNQSLHEIEIIFINDNSNAETVKELQKFQDEDDRVLVLSNKKNLKAGLSRQRGLRIAKGDYVLFADCDDCLITDACEVLFTKAKKNNADIVYSSYKVVQPGGKVNYVNSFKDRKYDLNYKKDIYHAFLSNNNALWNKLFRTDLIRNIEFPIFEVNIGEDRVFNIKAFVKAKKIFQTEYISYKYTQHEDSVTGNISKGVDYLKVIKHSTQEVTSILEESSYSFINNIDIERRYTSIYFYGLDCIDTEVDYESKQRMWGYWKIFFEDEVLPRTKYINKNLIKSVSKYKESNLDFNHKIARYIISMVNKFSTLFILIKKIKL